MQRLRVVYMHRKLFAGAEPLDSRLMFTKRYCQVGFIISANRPLETSFEGMFGGMECLYIVLIRESLCHNLVDLPTMFSNHDDDIVIMRTIQLNS